LYRARIRSRRAERSGSDEEEEEVWEGEEGSSEEEERLMVGKRDTRERSWLRFWRGRLGVEKRLSSAGS